MTTPVYNPEQQGALGVIVNAVNRQGEAIKVIQPSFATTATPASSTPVAATVSQVTTGGTAVTVVTGPINGGFITNPLNAARQGIVTAEPIYVDLVGTPGSTDAAANGTTVAIDPGQTFTLPALTAGVTVKVNAATSGHKLSVEIW